MALMPADIDLVYDKKNETRIETSIFPEIGVKQAKAKVEELEKQLSELNAQKASLSDPAMLAGLEKNLDRIQKQLSAYRDNPDLKRINSISGRRSRMRQIAKLREDYSRYNS